MDEKIIIVGNYGAKNIGDEAILEGILLLLEEERGINRKNITVLSYNPQDTIKRHAVQSEYLFPFGIRSLLKCTFWKTARAVRKADIVLVGGGGLFTDEKMKAMWLWAYQIKMLSLFCKHVVLFANSVGPIRTKRGARIMKIALRHCSAYTVRDKASRQLLKNFEVHNPIYLSADPAFYLNKKSVQKKEKNVVVSLRPWIFKTEEVIESMTLLCNKIQEDGYKIILMPFQIFQDDDRKVLEKLYSNMMNKNSVQFIRDERTVEQSQKIIGSSQFLIGMRLHSLILSIIEQTPFIAIGYSNKIRNLLSDIEYEDYYVGLNSLSSDFLLQKWAMLKDNREKIQEHLTTQYAKSRAKVLDNLIPLKRGEGGSHNDG